MYHASLTTTPKRKNPEECQCPDVLVVLVFCLTVTIPYCSSLFYFFAPVVLDGKHWFFFSDLVQIHGQEEPSQNSLLPASLCYEAPPVLLHP